MSKNTIRALILIIAVVAIAVIVITIRYTDNPTVNTLHANTTPIPTTIHIDTQHQPVLGNPNAPLKIVVFEDLKCVACRAYNLTTYPTIEKDYIATGKANYTMITLAFIPGSLPAANAAHCVYLQNHNAFFDYVKYIYHHQPPESENWATIPTLLDFASHLKNINQKKLADCIIKQPYDAVFTKNMELAQKVMGTQISTPRLYVNGINVSPPTLTQFKRVIARVSQ